MYVETAFDNLKLRGNDMLLGYQFRSNAQSWHADVLNYGKWASRSHKFGQFGYFARDSDPVKSHHVSPERVLIPAELLLPDRECHAGWVLDILQPPLSIATEP